MPPLAPLALALVAAACQAGPISAPVTSGHGEPTGAAAPASRAAPTLQERFELPGSQAPLRPWLALEGEDLVLSRAALGTPMLLRVQMVLADHAPSVTYGQPKVVMFVRHGDTLALMQPAPQAIYSTLPSERLLETFAVVGEDAGTVRFRWPFGLHAISTRQPYAPSDVPSDVMSYIEPEEAVLPIDEGFVRDRTMQDGALVTHQLARTRTERIPLGLFNLVAQRLDVEPTDATLQVSYRLEPLAAKPHFAVQQQNAWEEPRYFQLAHLRPLEGDVDYLTMRWDTDPALPPITFDLSSGLPPHLAEAVAEGVLYWNRVAGRTLVRVNRGVDAALMPPPRHVAVRWIPWRRAGFARAHMHAHPLTGEILARENLPGEILAGEIFLASTWAEPTPQLMSDEAGGMPIEPEAGRPHGARTPASAAFAALATAAARSPYGPQQACSLQPGPSDALLAAGAEVHVPLLVRRAMADQMRLVVAHEAGHVLGLRHNFAGSLDAELGDVGRIDAAWRSYRSGARAGAPTSSSVMDYSGEVDGFLLGAHIRAHTLPYDVEAIAQGYGTAAGLPAGPHAAVDPERGPRLFCTDMESLRGVLGCAAHDSGHNPIEGAVYRAQLAYRGLPARLLQVVMQRLHPRHAVDRLTPNQVVQSIRVQAFSAAVYTATEEICQGARKGARVLPVERRFGHLRAIDPNSYAAANLGQRRAWLAEAGGMPGVLERVLGPELMALPVDEDEAAPAQRCTPAQKDASGWMQAELEARMAQAERTGLLRVGQAEFPIDAAELGLLRTYAPLWGRAIEQAVLRDVLLTLTGAPAGPSSESVQQGLMAALGELMGAVPHLEPALVSAEWEAPLARMAQGLVLARAGQTAGRVGHAATCVPRPRLGVDVRLAALRLLSPEVMGTPGWAKQARDQLAAVQIHRIKRALTGQSDARTGSKQALLQLLGMGAPEEGVRFAELSPELQAWARDELRVLRALLALDAPRQAGAEGGLKLPGAAGTAGAGAEARLVDPALLALGWHDVQAVAPAPALPL